MIGISLLYQYDFFVFVFAVFRVFLEINLLSLITRSSAIFSAPCQTMKGFGVKTLTGYDFELLFKTERFSIVWENIKQQWRHSPLVRGSTSFPVFLNVHSCSHNLNENIERVMVSLNENTKSVFCLKRKHEAFSISVLRSYVMGIWAFWGQSCPQIIIKHLCQT